MPSNAAELPDVEHVIPFGDADQACFDELREVLARHGNLQRFGITLLHGHFPISDDEVLVESIDVDNRVLTLRPKPRAVTADGLATSWRLDVSNEGQRCETYCERDRDSDGKPIHRRRHSMVR